MRTADQGFSCHTATGPRKRPLHYSYDQNVDEPATLLEQEEVDIEEETPAEDTEPIEQIEPEDGPNSAEREN